MARKEYEPGVKNAVEVFLSEIERKQLPIHSKDASNFALNALKHKPPLGFFSRLISDMQYIDEPTFNEHLHIYGEEVKRQMKNKPYAVLFDSEVSNGPWIYDQLLQQGLSPATHEFALFHEKTPKAFDLERLKDELPKDYSILIVDDMLITGVQLEDLLNRQLIPESKYSITAALMYSLPIASKRLSSVAQPHTFISMYDINDNFTHMTNADRQLLLRLARSERYVDPDTIDQLDSNRGDLMFWTWYRVPDMFLKILAEQADFPLIRESRFKQPYRS